MADYGVITEQGDLGLGFDPLNQKDQKVVNEAVQKEKEQQRSNNSQVLNEKK